MQRPYKQTSTLSVPPFLAGANAPVKYGKGDTFDNPRVTNKMNGGVPGFVFEQGPKIDVNECGKAYVRR